VLYTQYPRYFRLLQRLSLLPLIIALMALLSIYSPPLSAPMNMVLSVLYLALIAQVINRPGFMEHRALKWVGQRSYGMYIWHNTLISAAYFLGLPDLVVVPAVLVGVLLVSTLSYQYLERPFLRLKNRWRTSDQVVVATASLP
jgi:peptidoglycan/LPS O-acetylase OafA/YrhL